MERITHVMPANFTLPSRSTSRTIIFLLAITSAIAPIADDEHGYSYADILKGLPEPERLAAWLVRPHGDHQQH